MCASKKKNFFFFSTLAWLMTKICKQQISNLNWSSNKIIKTFKNKWQDILWICLNVLFIDTQEPLTDREDKTYIPHTQSAMHSDFIYNFSVLQCCESHIHSAEVIFRILICSKKLSWCWTAIMNLPF